MRVTSSTRHGRLAAALLAVVVTLIVVPANAAQAHHGFDDFDTDRPYYIAGTVSQVRWGDPHSYFRLTLESDRPADTPSWLCLSSCRRPKTAARSTTPPRTAVPVTSWTSS